MPRLGQLSSGLVMYPLGHARNTSGELEGVLAHKFRALASLGVSDVEALYRRFTGLAEKSCRRHRSGSTTFRCELAPPAADSAHERQVIGGRDASEVIARHVDRPAPARRRR